MDEEKEKPRRSGVFAYLAVMLAGLLCVSAVWFLVPDRGQAPQPVPVSTKEASSSETPGTEEEQRSTPAASSEVPPEASSAQDETPDASLQTPEGVPSEPLPTLPPVQVETYVEGEVVDSFYQYVNDYDWQDLYTLMILIGQTGIGLNEGSEGKHASFSIFSVNPEFDPMIFVGFTDPATNVSVMTLYITDHGYAYELLKVFNDRIYIDPAEGALCTANGNATYRYSPHVLMKLPKAAGEIPAGFVPLPITDATNIKITRQDVESYLVRYGKGGQ